MKIAAAVVLQCYSSDRTTPGTVLASSPSRRTLVLEEDQESLRNLSADAHNKR